MTRSNLFCCSIILFLFFSATSRGQAQNKRSFLIYNAIAYKDAPDLTSEGLSKLNMYYGFSLVTADAKNKQHHYVDREKIKNTAINALKTPNVPVCLDIESWNPTVDSSKQQALANYIEVLKVFRKYNTRSRIGYYSLMPYPDFLLQHLWGKDKRKDWGQEWTKANNFLKPITKEVDISFPSFYTLVQNDTLTWKKMVIAQVAKVKSFKKNIPVYGFIWPQYHPSNKLVGNQFIDADTWRFQLETLYKYCDGIVIWGTPYYYQDKKLVYVSWNEKDAWWKVTQQFIKKYNIKSSSGTIRTI